MALRQDLRYATRLLRSRPGFSVLAILTLALGIGANTAIFSVVNGLMFRTLPGAKQADSLVSISILRSGFLFPMGMSYPNYQDFAQLKEAFSGAIVSSFMPARLSDNLNDARRVQLTMVSSNYFGFLGVPMALGRDFTADEAKNMGSGNVLVLSNEEWRAHFASDPTVIGRSVKVNGNPFTIIGVAPADFSGTQGLLVTDGYVPTTAGDRLSTGVEKWLASRGAGGWNVIARLQDGVSVEQAGQAAHTLADRLAKDWPEDNPGLNAVVYPESRTRLEPSAAVYLPPIATVFMSLVGLVLLIACANLANLLLVRGISRRKEVAIRSSLGASRLSIVRQFMVESLVLAFLGGAAGLLMARWGAAVLAGVSLATDIRMRFDFSLDYRVFAFALIAATLAGLLAGLVPAVQASKTNLSDAMKEGGDRGGSARRHWLRSGLVVVQLAVSLVLLVAAGLFVRSMLNVAAMDWGFAIEGRLMLTTDADLAGMSEEQGREFYHRLLEEARALPGVVSASTAQSVPFGMGQDGSDVYIEGRDLGGKDAPMILSNVVNTDYFATIGTPLLRGRAFGEGDQKDTPGVAIINERMAEEFFPGKDPLGQRISIKSANGPWLEIVGIAKTTQYIIPGENPRAYVYLPFTQNYRTAQILHISAKSAPEALLPMLRERIRALAPEMPIFDVRTMRTHIEKGKASVIFELGSGLVGCFGLIGLILAAIGLYGVMALRGGQRTREFGIRIALGASAKRLVGEVLGHGVGLALLGIGLGVTAALFVTGLFAHLLVGVGPRDPVVFGLVALFLLGSRWLQAWFRRYGRAGVDPMTSLRCE
jgi:predicted permease